MRRWPFVASFLEGLYFLGKNSMHRKDIVASILGFNEGSLPFTYLGVPVFKGIPTRYFLQPIAVRKIGPLRKAELFGSLPVGLLTSLPPFSWWNITMPELQLCLRSSPALLGCITHPAPKVRSLLFVILREWIAYVGWELLGNSLIVTLPGSRGATLLFCRSSRSPSFHSSSPLHELVQSMPQR